MIAVSREAVQTAEDARAIAVKKMDEARLAHERRASANAQAKSQGQADDANRQKELAQADAARSQADAAGRSPIWPPTKLLRQPQSPRLRRMPRGLV